MSQPSKIGPSWCRRSDRGGPRSRASRSRGGRPAAGLEQARPVGVLVPAERTKLDVGHADLRSGGWTRHRLAEAGCIGDGGQRARQAHGRALAAARQVGSVPRSWDGLVAVIAVIVAAAWFAMPRSRWRCCPPRDGTGWCRRSSIRLSRRCAASYRRAIDPERTGARRSVATAAMAARLSTSRTGDLCGTDRVPLDHVAVLEPADSYAGAHWRRSRSVDRPGSANGASCDGSTARLARWRGALAYAGDGRAASKAHRSDEPRQTSRVTEDDVHELAAAGQDDLVRASGRRGWRRSSGWPGPRPRGRRPVRSAGDGQLVAQLAVDLDRDLAGRLGRGGHVDLGPRLGVDRRPLAAGRRRRGATRSPR